MKTECSVKCRVALVCSAGVFSVAHIPLLQETHQQPRLVISDAQQYDTQECRTRESPPTADSHALRAAKVCGSLCRCVYAYIWRAVKCIGGVFKVPSVFQATLCLHPGPGCRCAACPLSGGFWQGGFPPDRSREERGKDLICCHFLNLWTQTHFPPSLPFCHSSSLRTNEMNIYWRREMSRWRRFWRTLTWTQTSKE